MTGAIYCWEPGGQGGIIAYNWVHNDSHCNRINLDKFRAEFFDPTMLVPSSSMPVAQ